MNKLIEHLVYTGQMFCFGEHGELYSLVDLLTDKMGREVSFDEAIAYILKNRANARKQHFITRIKELSLAKA